MSDLKLFEDQPKENIDMKQKKSKQALPTTANQFDSLIQMAVNKDFDIARLEKLIALRNEEQKRQAESLFYEQFSAMQKVFTAAKKTKKGYDYMYAPLEVLQAQFGPIISEYGFSYRWTEEEVPNKPDWKRVRIIITGWGYTDDKTFFDVPPIEGTKQNNAIQVRGIMFTYGRRYTFMAGFGLVVEGEDTDGTFEDGIAYGECFRAIREAKTIEDLMAIFKPIYNGLKSDQRGKELVTAEYNKRKKELQNGTTH